jgi:hypothetical protein
MFKLEYYLGELNEQINSDCDEILKEAKNPSYRWQHSAPFRDFYP